MLLAEDGKDKRTVVLVCACTGKTVKLQILKCTTDQEVNSRLKALSVALALSVLALSVALAYIAE